MWRIFFAVIIPIILIPKPGLRAEGDDLAIFEGHYPCIGGHFEGHPIVWMDAIHYKIRNEKGSTETRAIYNVLALDQTGHKDLTGILLSSYFQYTAPIRRIIYTTNIVEGYHRQVHKITKTKGVFPNDNALYKLVYLAYRNIRKKWTMPVANWGITAQQLAIKFGDRLNIM